MSSDSMSDVDISDVDEVIVAEYTPMEVKRGIKLFWRVEDKAVCVKKINAHLKVLSICIVLTDIIGAQGFQVDFRMQKEKRSSMECGSRFILPVGWQSIHWLQPLYVDYTSPKSESSCDSGRDYGSPGRVPQVSR
jgi:hypothetical protein